MSPRLRPGRRIAIALGAALAVAGFILLSLGSADAGPAGQAANRFIYLPVVYGRLPATPTPSANATATATPRADASPTATRPANASPTPTLTVPTTPGTWSTISSPAGIAFFGVDMVRDDVWVVGSRGRVLHSTNAGASFSQVNVDSDADLYGVDFLDNQFGVIVGLSGTIRWTKDGGKTWTFGGGTQNEALGSVSLTDANTGWASGGGGTILKTTDGGKTWQRQNSGFGGDINSIWFINANTGWAAGANGIILNTTNGGTNWNRQKEPGNETDSLSGIYFRDSQNGFAGGDPSPSGGGFQSNLWRTTNGGANWGRVSLPIAGPALTAIRFANDTLGWLSAEERIVLKTTNGGTTWTVDVPPLQPPNLRYWLYGIAVRSDGAAVAVGSSYPNNGSFDPVESVIMRRTPGS